MVGIEDRCSTVVLGRLGRRRRRHNYNSSSKRFGGKLKTSVLCLLFSYAWLLSDGSG